MEDLHEKLKKELEEEELKEHQAKLDGIDRKDIKMDKQIDNAPSLAIIFTGWLITIIILLLIEPELTRNEFFALWLITSTIMGLLRHIFKQS